MEQKKLMADLVLGQQCTPGNYKHKGKNLGLYSAQLSQIIARVDGNKKGYPKKGDYEIKQIKERGGKKETLKKKENLEIKGEPLTL